MARFCGVCKQFLRINDPGATFDVPAENRHGASAGHYSGCSECAHEFSDRSGQYAGYVFQLTCDAGFSPLGHGDLVRAIMDSDPSSPTYGVCPYVPAGRCGMCGMFAREDDRMEAVRVWRDMGLSPEEEAKFIPADNDNACYSACRDCQRKYWPLIRERLKRLKLIPATWPDGTITAQVLC